MVAISRKTPARKRSRISMAVRGQHARAAASRFEECRAPTVHEDWGTATAAARRERAAHATRGQDGTDPGGRSRLRSPHPRLYTGHPRRRDGRVAEGARLESVYTGNRIVGSNPTPSASP